MASEVDAAGTHTHMHTHTHAESPVRGLGLVETVPAADATPSLSPTLLLSEPGPRAATPTSGMVWPEPFCEPLAASVRALPEDVLQDVWVHARVCVCAVTWNMNGKGADVDAVREVLRSHPRGAGRADAFHVYAVGTQECERGIASSMINPSKEKWESTLSEAIGPAYFKVASQTLAATHIAVYAHAALRPVVNDVRTSFVPCGVGNVLGNKGGVAVGFNIGKTALLFTSAHLAAHQRAVRARNRDYWTIETRMPLVPAGFGLEASLTAQQEAERLKHVQVASSDSPGTASAGQPAAQATALQFRGGAAAAADSDEDEGDDDSPETDVAAASRSGPALQAASPARVIELHDDAAPGPARTDDTSTTTARPLFYGSGVPLNVSDRYDRVFFLGDFNYRINLTRADADAALARNDHAVMWKHDQFRQELEAGNIFVGFEEPPLRFRPTYKFDKGTDTYDTSEKRRIPAWCDRICYKSPDKSIRAMWYCSASFVRTSDHRAVLGGFEVGLRGSHHRRSSTNRERSATQPAGASLDTTSPLAGSVCSPIADAPRGAALPQGAAPPSIAASQRAFIVTDAERAHTGRPPLPQRQNVADARAKTTDVAMNGKQRNFAGDESGATLSSGPPSPPERAMPSAALPPSVGTGHEASWDCVRASSRIAPEPLESGGVAQSDDVSAAAGSRSDSKAPNQCAIM